MLKMGVLLELAHHWRLLQACGRAATTPVARVIGFDDHRRGMIVWVPLELRFLRTFSRTSANGYRLRSALERYDHEHGFRVHVAQQAMIREPDDPRRGKSLRLRRIGYRDQETGKHYELTRIPTMTSRTMIEINPITDQVATAVHFESYIESL